MTYQSNELNLNKINIFKKKFKLPIGYSNHFNSKEIFKVLSSYNPDSIFFYVKGVHQVNYLDNLHALNINNVKKFTNNIKLLKKAIGTKSKLHIEKNLKL